MTDERVGRELTDSDRIIDMQNLMIHQYQEVIREHLGFKESRKKISPHDAKLLFGQVKMLHDKDAKAFDALKSDLRMVRESQERQRQLNDAQSLEIQNLETKIILFREHKELDKLELARAREVISFYATNDIHSINFDYADNGKRARAYLGADKSEVVSNEPMDTNTMIYLAGSKQSFRCDCGGNVFTKWTEEKFQCNSCKEKYLGT